MIWCSVKISPKRNEHRFISKLLSAVLRLTIFNFYLNSRIAQTLDLRTKSYGKNNSRHIVISTKLSPQVLRQKLLEGDPYLLEKYEIIPPPQRTKMKWK